jgi:phosphoglycolate phosphatase-like HAD superfamily hydrolase
MSNYIRLEWEKQQQHHSPSPTNLPDILQDFYQRIGWDDETQSVIPSAPLAAGTWQDQVVRVTQLLREYQVVESDAAAAKKAQEWQDALSLLHACDPPLIPGLPNLLTHLSKDYSWKVAICTSDDRGSTNAALQHWNVADVIQVRFLTKDLFWLASYVLT